MTQPTPLDGAPGSGASARREREGWNADARRTMLHDRHAPPDVPLPAPPSSPRRRGLAVRVVAKFLLAFVAVTAACVVAFGYLAARREVREIEASVASDLRVLGDALREGMLVASASAGDEAVAAIVRAVDARRADVEVDWHAAGPASAPATDVQVGPHGRALRVHVPVRLASGREGVLTLAQGVPSEATILREELVDELGVSLALVLGLGVVAVVLGGALIGRPLERVVAQARRIGEGDFSRRLAPSGTDEIATLERELDAMCDRLVDAQARVEAQSAARVETLEQLRHLDRLRTVGTLASSLAHELGTPLNVLRIRARSLASGEIDAAEVGDAGRVVEAQVEKMSALVRRLLDFSRRRHAAVAEVRVSDVAHGAAALLGSLARKHGVAIDVRVVDDAIVVADREQLEQALSNLVINAIQAMSGGGSLRIEVRRERDVAVPGASTTIDAAVVEVVDGGPGISEDDLARVFEPFYTTKPPGLGTGLGLSVASGIAADAGGFVRAKSAVGVGSSFALCLPRVA